MTKYYDLKDQSHFSREDIQRPESTPQESVLDFRISASRESTGFGVSALPKRGLFKIQCTISLQIFVFNQDEDLRIPKTCVTTRS